MKTRAKALAGLVFSALAVGAVVVYFVFWAGGPQGAGMLKACRAISLVASGAGLPVVGVEDIAVDEARGVAYLSAYDRRRVKQEEKTGRITTQGGIYALGLAELRTGGDTISVVDLTAGFRERGDFRPHGIGLVDGNPPMLFAINRLYHEDIRQPVVDGFAVRGDKLEHRLRFSHERLCTANDVLPLGPEAFLVSHDRRHCGGAKRRWEEAFGPRGGYVTRYREGAFSIVLQKAGFPNGIALFTDETGRERLVVAHTLERILAVFEKEDVLLTRDPFDGFLENIPLQGPPDNLTVDGHGDLYIAILPKPFRFAWYIGGMAGKAPSAVFRLREGNSDADSLQLLFNDDGSLISGATVAARLEDYLLIGSAWDDHIAVCEGMGALD